MADTAAHFVDPVFPELPIFLRIIEQSLRAHSPGAGPRARLGAVSFVHRFGSALNPHVRFHCYVLD